MKPKNDTLKNDEQPCSFIQQNWLLLLTLLIFAGIIAALYVPAAHRFDSLPSLNMLWWWENARDAFFLAGLFLPVYLVINVVTGFFKTRRRPRARFFGLITTVLAVFSFFMAANSQIFKNTYNRLPAVKMSEAREYSVVVWSDFLQHGYVIYAHNPDNESSVHVIARDDLDLYGLPMDELWRSI